MTALVHLDFVNRRTRSPLLGAVLLTVGVIAAAAVLLESRMAVQRREGLELKLAALSGVAHRSPEQEARAAREAVAASKTEQELAAPWTMLLAELEDATKDTAGQVSVLAVEPDHAKHKVHVNGESQNLALAIAFVQRLQMSHSLKYPMLDSHELRQDDPQHPVRFEVSADWQDGL
jgi:hypothetical protein